MSNGETLIIHVYERFYLQTSQRTNRLISVDLFEPANKEEVIDAAEKFLDTIHLETQVNGMASRDVPINNDDGLIAMARVMEFQEHPNVIDFQEHQSR